MADPHEETPKANSHSAMVSPKTKSVIETVKPGSQDAKPKEVTKADSRVNEAEMPAVQENGTKPRHQELAEELRQEGIERASEVAQFIKDYCEKNDCTLGARIDVVNGLLIPSPTVAPNAPKV